MCSRCHLAFQKRGAAFSVLGPFWFVVRGAFFFAWEKRKERGRHVFFFADMWIGMTEV